MRAFGSLRIASVVVLLFLSLAASMPKKKAPDDYLDDAGEEEDTDIILDDDQAPNVSGPVVLRSKSVTKVVRPGETVELPCFVENGESTSINWVKDDLTIFADEELLDNSDTRFTRADNFSLIIRNVTEKDASDFWHCQILLQQPPTELYHKLRVVEEPRQLWTGIQVTPDRHVEVNENESITLGCKTNNEPNREIKWSKGERLQNNDEYRIEGNFITIKKVKSHHTGRYQCLVEDNSENPPTDVIEVVVNYAPRIELERQVVHTGIGRRSELTCIVHAHPHAKVTWFKFNKKFNKERQITQIEGKHHIDDKKSHRTLFIERTTKEDLGQYICKAKNKNGETSRMIELTGAPSQPRIHGGEVSDDEPTFILKWLVESFAPIVEYKLEYRQKDKREWKTVSPVVTDGIGNQFTVEYTLEKLQPGSYEARLQARNDYGWSLHSDVHNFREGYKSERAENVKGSAVTRQPLLALTTLLVVLVTSYQSSCL